jgi:transcriptional regulator with GAF, ATPase, and Fis domain
MAKTDGARDISTARMVEALRKNDGLVYAAAKSLKCSPSTIYKRAKREAEIQAAIDELPELLVDVAVKKLYSAVRKGEAWAVREMLRSTRGRKRGFGDGDEGTRNVTIKVRIGGGAPNEEDEGLGD